MNCADNSGTKNLYVISVTSASARLNRLPAGSDITITKNRKAAKGKNAIPSVITCRRGNTTSKDIFLYFEETARD